ncbi:MAG: hypothetical protein ACI9KE_001235 [Polyangiales bacterium]|jgi:hypothetical protein
MPAEDRFDDLTLLTVKRSVEKPALLSRRYLLDLRGSEREWWTGDRRERLCASGWAQHENE